MRSMSLLQQGAAVALLAGLFSSDSSAQGTATSDQEFSSRIDLVVNQIMRQRGIPGAAVAVLRADSLILMRGYGVSDMERGTRVTPRTVFQLASLTKPFTAMAVLLLADEGKVDLDAPAAAYLEWLPGRYGAVTVRQLLHHTSGVAPDMRRANIDEMPETEFRLRFLERPASFPPGSSWQYANAGYTLLSQIVERVAGQTFGEFLQKRIFAPLGMTETGYRVPEQRDSRHAIGYDFVDGTLQRAPHVFSGWGNSGMESTVADLARWAVALNQGRLLTRRSHAAMFTPGMVSGDTTLNFGLRSGRSAYGAGWFLISERGDSIFSHGGAIAGFSSVLSRIPHRGWTIIVLSNMKQGNDRQGQAEVIAAGILDVLRASVPP